MREVVLSIVSLMFLSGCGTISSTEVRAKSELKYKKILVLPFTQGDGGNASLARESYSQELSIYPNIEVIGKQMDETTIKNLGVFHSESFGALDFSSSQESDERRRKVLSSFPADAIIFGYSYTDQGLLSLHIQMMDSESGAVILSFSKDTSIPENLSDQAARDLARKSAQKTIDFLKDNVIITRIHRR